MEEKKIVVDKPVTFAGLTLIPVTQVSLSLSSARAGTAFLVVKRPVAVVVVSPQAKRSFRTTGEEVSLEKLMQEVPSLEEMLK